MANYNKVILVGNLTRDPQLNQTPSGVAVCEFGMAVNHTWRDKDGNKREEVCFIDGNIFGRGAEIFQQYMSKGRQALIEGRLRFDQWTTPEGQKRSRHRVWVESFQFLGGGAGGGRPADAAEYGVPASAGAGRVATAPAPAAGGGPDYGAQSYAPPAYADDAPPPPSDADVPF